MKKTAFLTLILLGLSTNVYLVEAQNKTPQLSPTSIIQQSRNKKALNNSIYLYQKRYHQQKEETLADKNLYYTQLRAAQARRAGHVGSHRYSVPRTGALTDWSNTQRFAQPSIERANSKSVFRRCIINYYFEGGNCSTQELQEGVIYGSQHTVNTIPTTFWTRDIQVINELRDMQRQMKSSDPIGAGQQRQRAVHNGDSSRNFTSPYTKPVFTPESK